jgi:beta-phosphoglucomutase
MPKYTGVIFDLDGVIVDTAKFHFYAWKRLAKTLGFNISPEDDRKLKGVSRIQALKILLDIGDIDIDTVNLDELAALKNTWYLEYIMDITEDAILPGAKELILKLKELKIGIALGSASKNSKLLLKRLGLIQLFDAIVDGTVVELPKPHPAVFLTAAKLLGMDTSECVVIEDSEAGIRSALHAEIFSISVGSERYNNLADLHVDDLTQVPVTDLFA